MARNDKHTPDIYATLTGKIIAAIEANPGEPVMPWQRGGVLPVIPKNASTGNDYRGINILSLWIRRSRLTHRVLSRVRALARANAE